MDWLYRVFVPTENMEKEIKESEDRLLQRENNMDKRDELFQKRELSLDEKIGQIMGD